MIKTLSPYYVNIPLDFEGTPLDKYVIYIWIWEGSVFDKPIQPEYQLTRNNPTQSIDTDKVNIANLVDDFIDFEPQQSTTTEVLSGNNQVWVNVMYEGYISDVSTGITDLLTDAATSGYTYAMDGENYQNPSKILLDGDEFNASRKSSFIVPLKSEGGSVAVTSLPYGEISELLTVPNNNESDDDVSYLWVQCSDIVTDNTIQIVYQNEEVYLYLTNEYRYEPIDIHFKNKEGAQQVLTFFKERRSNVSIKGESYNSNAGQPLNGYHQVTDYNKNSNTKFTVNSGFVDEEMNATFHQLMLSDRVWAFEDGIFIPINIGSKSLEYKTQINDRLINYSIEFTYSFDDINNI